MAAIRITRGKLIRFLPSFLQRKEYCISASIQPYVYHPQSRVLEPENQALYLTKTLQMGDVSSCLQDTVIDPTAREEIMAKFKQNVIQTRLINFEGDHATRDMCSLPLMQNMLRVVWSYSSRFPSLLEMSLTYKPRVGVSYERDDTNLLVSGDLGFLLSSKHQLKQIKDTEEVKNAGQVLVEKPEIISPFFNLNKTKSVQKVDTGFYDDAPFPHTHTLVIVSTNRKWSTSDLVAQGIMYTFGRLAAEALNHGASLGDDIQKPLTAQCIATDGIRLSFLCYQLNTLDLNKDSGIKNMVWISPGVFMYQKAVLNEIPGARKKDPATYEIEVQGFNYKCFETFVRMILNGPHAS